MGNNQQTVITDTSAEVLVPFDGPLFSELKVLGGVTLALEKNSHLDLTALNDLTRALSPGLDVLLIAVHNELKGINVKSASNLDRRRRSVGNVENLMNGANGDAEIISQWWRK